MIQSKSVVMTILNMGVNMIREELECLNSYVKSLYDRSLNNGCNVAVIKHTNRIKISKDEVAGMLPEEYTSRVFCHCFEENVMGEAYSPFLHIVEELITTQGLERENFIKDAGVYALHEAVFDSYFATGKCVRLEEPLFSEVKFENEKLIKGIANMLVKACGEQDIFIVLNKLNYAGASTLEFLNYIINIPESEHIRILAFDNENGKVRVHEEEHKNRFDAHCEEIGCVFEWPVNSGVVENVTENGFVFDGDDMETYLVNTYNMFCMFAYDEMRYFLDFIYQKVQIENVGITKEQEVRLYMQLATLAVLQGDCSHALLVAESLHQLSEEMHDWQIEYGYHYIIAYVNMHNGNINAAEAASERCISLARDKGDSRAEFKGKIAKVMSKFSGFYNILISYENYPMDEELLEQCKEYHYYNHLAHIYVHCFENDSFHDKTLDSIEMDLPYFNKGIEIGEMLGNDQFLTDAYRSIIMLASYSGKRDIVNYFYEKDILVAQRSGNLFEEAMVYNGLGYNHCSGEDYKSAHYYFNQAMKIFHQLGLCDYIIETFYNMAINAIMAEEYENATTYLEKTLYLLKINKKNSLRVCNISKAIGMIALSTFYQGRIYSTRNYLVKDGQFLDYIIEDDHDSNKNYLWDDDLFLYFICQALLCNYSGKYEEAIEIYERAEVYMNRSQGNYFFAYPQFCMAKQYTLQQLGLEEERLQLLEDYKKFCKKNGYLRHLQAVNRLIAGPDEDDNIDHDTLNCPIINEVCEAERLRCIEREARSRRKETQFFSLFQNLLDKREENISERMSNVLSALASNYNLDGIVTIYISGDERSVYQEKSKPMTEENVDLLVNFFEEKRSGFAVSKYNGNYKDYRKLFSVMFGDKVFSMVGVPIFENEKLTAVFVAYTKSRENWNASTDRYVLSDYDLEIYTYLFRQIINAIKKWQANDEIERMNNLLKQQAVTDELTGLFNRQGYYSIIRSVVSNKEARNQKYAFIYLDLDHFKYYNDTFGHHVGDAILISFANIFRKMAPEGASTIRLGGDEFAIILTYQDRADVVRIAENILSEIEKAEGFEDVVERFALKEFKLEKEHYAGCSIGIAYLEGVTSEEDFETIRKNADAALYYVKEHGRNSYKVFGDL